MKLIAGPCVLEDVELSCRIAKYVKTICEDLGFDYIFKGSFDKANRTHLQSFRGPGLYEGVKILKAVKEEVGVKVTTDIHQPWHASFPMLEENVDVIQIPAFLCRQTDLLTSAGGTQKIVNIKKGQFMHPLDMQSAVQKALIGGAAEVWLTERGNMFGYDNLVVDFRHFKMIRNFADLIFDATHSSKGRDFIAPLTRAAVAAGVDGLFFEVYPEPEKAKCDGHCSLPLNEVRPLLEDCLRINDALWKEEKETKN